MLIFNSVSRTVLYFAFPGLAVSRFLTTVENKQLVVYYKVVYLHI